MSISTYSTGLIAATALAILPMPPLGAAEFFQDFEKVGSVEGLMGAGDGQFDFVGMSGQAATMSIVDESFQVAVEYDPALPGMQNSGVRLTRLTPVTAGANFMVVRFDFLMKPDATPGARTPVATITVGQNFRPSPFSPAREGRANEGPVFASVSMVVGKKPGLFMLSTGPRDFSGEFPAESNTNAFIEFPLTLAFNSGNEPVAFNSPAGAVEIAPGTFSAWLGVNQVWAAQPAAHPGALLENFSFGLGRGTDSTGAEGAVHDGLYRLQNIRVLAEQK